MSEYNLRDLQTAYDQVESAFSEAKSLRADRLKHIRSEVRKTTEKMLVEIAGNDAETGRKIASYMYWDFGLIPSVPSAVRDAYKHIYHEPFDVMPSLWAWCDVCGKELFVNSIAEMKREMELERDVELCDECRRKMIDERYAGALKQEEDRRLRIKELRAMPYQEYLQTPEWQEKRKAALKRAHYRCQLCNSTGAMNVHHRTYERRGDELARDLIVLCGGCHEKFHNIIIGE